MYKYGIIDFELINRRNAAVLKDLSKNLLLKVNLASIFKLMRENNFDIPILCFDSKPYFKSKFINEYKSNRKVYTIDDLNEFEEDSNEYKKILNDINRNAIIKEVKDYIINNWNHFSIPIFYNGLEADDISIYISYLITEKCIHITKDSDWEYHCSNENHDVIILKKSGNILYKYDSILEYNIPLNFQKVFFELFKNSHNGISIKKLNLSNNEIYDLYKKEELDSDIILRINGLNPLSYLTEDIKNFINNKIYNHKLYPDIKYLQSYNIIKHHEIESLYNKLVNNDYLDELI